jgi:hypothetical protein
VGTGRYRRIAGDWLWALGGVAAALLLWLAVVPWDLSEVETVQPVPGYDYSGSGEGGDEYAFQIAVVLVMVAGLAVGFVLAGRRKARWLATAGAATWAALFCWRAAVARTSGANMWFAGFVIVIAPAAIGVHLAVHAIARRRRDRASATPGRTRGSEGDSTTE